MKWLAHLRTPCRWLVGGALASALSMPVLAEDALPMQQVVMSSVAWQTLSPAQRQILAPLASQWNGLPPESQVKWVQVADRYPSLPPESQQRVIRRMNLWAGMSDAERNQARLRYQQARQMSPEELQQRWQAYQALSEDERRDLARVGLRKKNPVLLGDAQSGPREMGQLQVMRPRSDNRQAKQNIVPPTSPVPSTAVATGLVKAGPGATTSLVNQMASPPLHQQTGLPKITATQGFVDPQTMLPLRGPQGAGMTPVVSKP